MRSHTADPIEVEYEIVGEGDGATYRPVSGPLSPQIAAMIAGLAGPLVRGREARALHLVLNALGYFRDPAAARAAMEANEGALNAWLSHLDLRAIATAIATDAAETRPGLLACATDPGAALPLFGTGALLGFALSKLVGGSADDDR